MKTINIQETATALDLLAGAKGGPVLLREPNGRAFVLVEVDGDDAETFALSENPDLDRILDRSRARARHEGWLSTEQIKAGLSAR